MKVELPNDMCDDAILSSSTLICKQGIQAPIGLFDSGIGGLSIYQHLKQKLPYEQYIYYADTLNVPYGARSKDEIRKLTLKAVKWLIEAGCKIIVIACNSASAYALDLVRDKYPKVPIVGLVPALKPAVLKSNAKHVAVLATQATLTGDLLNQVIAKFATPNGVKVTKWFDPDLVPWVESGMDINSETAQRLIEQIHKFAQQNIDYLVLGCTHYPFFRDFIIDEVGRYHLNFTVIDSGAAIASRVHDILYTSNMLAVEVSSGQAGSPNNDIHIDIIEERQARLSRCVHIPFNDSYNVVHDCHQPHNSPSSSIKANRLSLFEKAQETRAKCTQNKAQMAFFMTDPKTDMALMTKRIKGLLYNS